MNLVQVPPKGRFGEMISFEFHLKNRHEKTQKPLWFLGFQPRYLFRCYLLVAGEGLEPTTSGLWARRATNCSTPRYWFVCGKTVWCRKPGLNRYERWVSRDFKSRASANSAIPAFPLAVWQYTIQTSFCQYRISIFRSIPMNIFESYCIIILA